MRNPTDSRESRDGECRSLARRGWRGVASGAHRRRWAAAVVRLLAAEDLELPALAHAIYCRVDAVRLLVHVAVELALHLDRRAVVQA